MSSLRITVFAREQIILKRNYNNLLHGLLYSCFKERNPKLHDEGFRDGPMAYRLFVFGPLIGKVSKVDRRRCCYEGPITFEFRSPVTSNVEILASELQNRGTVSIGRYNLPLINLERVDRLVYPYRVARARTIQPIYVESNQRGLSPRDPSWLEHIQSNAASKARAWGGLDSTVSTDLQVKPLSDGVFQTVQIYKEELSCWTGEFSIACDQQLMGFLYDCGLGAKNSVGFGMFELDDTPL